MIWDIGILTDKPNAYPSWNISKCSKQGPHCPFKKMHWYLQDWRILLLKYKGCDQSNLDFHLISIKPNSYFHQNITNLWNKLLVLRESIQNSTLPVIPWLLILPILYSAFRDGNSAAPMAMPSNMALNLRTIGFFSRPSGSWGNSFVSIGVWLTLVGVFSEGSGVAISSLTGCGL